MLRLTLCTLAHHPHLSHYSTSKLTFCTLALHPHCSTAVHVYLSTHFANLHINHTFLNAAHATP